MVIVVGFIACAAHVALVVVGTPKAHTNVGDLHAGIKQSQLVALLQPRLVHFPFSLRPQRGVLVVLKLCTLCEVVINKWPAVAFPSCLHSDLGGSSG